MTDTAEAMQIEVEADGSASFETMRAALVLLGQRAGQWAGIPMPLGDHELIIEPTYPAAEILAQLSGTRVREEADKLPPFPDDFKVRNSWWSRKYGGDVWIFEEGGHIKKTITPAFHHLDQDMNSMGAHIAWGMEQELKALDLLKSLIRPHIFNMYFLTGMFIESSPRSNLTYMFRKLKPTVAISFRGGKSRILAALCMHPIGYYADSWSGAMCPTDDVIAHLMMMRGDEKMFWKRSNQIQPNRPQAGL